MVEDLITAACVVIAGIYMVWHVVHATREER